MHTNFKPRKTATHGVHMPSKLKPSFNRPKTGLKRHLINAAKPGLKRWAGWGENPHKTTVSTHVIPTGHLAQFIESGLSAEAFLASIGLLLPACENESTLPTVSPVTTAPNVAASERDKTERLACEWIARTLGGVLEFTLEAGRIDVLTESAVVEVKQAYNWKHALGQVLVYGSYFPRRIKMIVLVGNADRFIEIARRHCALLDVEVIDFREM
jgi:hypothetical protein